MKKYFDDLVGDVINGDLAFNAVKEHIDDYKEFILDNLYDNAGDFFYLYKNKFKASR